MLNVGLIGNTEILEPFVTAIKQNTEVNVIGKASIGTSAQLNSFHFSIPEFNRIELIERADIILMDNSTPMPFKFMRDIVRRSKHIFCVDYPDLSIEECTELNKLINESGSKVQVCNPYFFSAAIQWMNKNISMPAFIDYSNFEPDTQHNKSLYPMLLLLLGSTGISPKKIGAVTFPGFNNSEFSNVRLEFGDASVVNLNFGNLESLKNFKIRVYSDNQFATFNFTKGKFLCDNKPINMDGLNELNELDVFIDSILGKTKPVSTLEDYLIAMHVARKIDKKIAQFSAQ